MAVNSLDVKEAAEKRFENGGISRYTFKGRMIGFLFLLGASFGLAYNAKLGKDKDSLSSIAHIIRNVGNETLSNELWKTIETYETVVGIFAPLISGVLLEKVGLANMLKVDAFSSVLG